MGSFGALKVCCAILWAARKLPGSPEQNLTDRDTKVSASGLNGHENVFQEPWKEHAQNWDTQIFIIHVKIIRVPLGVGWV